MDRGTIFLVRHSERSVSVLFDGIPPSGNSRKRGIRASEFSHPERSVAESKDLQAFTADAFLSTEISGSFASLRMTLTSAVIDDIIKPLSVKKHFPTAGDARGRSPLAKEKISFFKPVAELRPAGAVRSGGRPAVGEETVCDMLYASENRL